MVMEGVDVVVGIVSDFIFFSSGVKNDVIDFQIVVADAIALECSIMLGRRIKR